MKKLIIAIVFFSITIGVHAQNKAIRTFYKNHKRSENVTKIMIPGFVIRMGGGIAKAFLKNHEDFAENKEALKLMSCLRGIRVLTIEDQQVSKADERFMVNSLKKAGKFEEMLTVREEETSIHIMVREKVKKRKNKKIIKGFFIAVNEGDSFTLLNLKTKIKPKHLDIIIDLLMQEIRDEEVVEKKEKKREQA